MKKLLKISLMTTLVLSATYLNADNTKAANSFADMFEKGSVSGQIRLGHISNTTSVTGTKNTTVTALGGNLKYESASYDGLSLGIAMQTSHSISALSGDSADGKYNEDLASAKKSYTELSEVYLNFSRNDFNFRAGRQLIDTPLADSDDIMMTPHTFEAYVASYAINDFTFIGANVQKWQGVDAGYANVNSSWADTGVDGTWMAAGLYSSEAIEAGVWYYDVTKAAKAIYADITGSISFSDDIQITLAAQYLTETETDSTGIEGSIAGAMAEASIFGATAILAYDMVSIDDTNQIFEGFGGGSSYTNMDTMTAGTLHDGSFGDGNSFVAGLAYDIASVNISVAYGDFTADAIGAGAKAHVTEMDIGLAYEYYNGQADVTLMYVIGEDKESTVKTAFDDSHVQLTLNYNF